MEKVRKIARSLQNVIGRDIGKRGIEPLTNALSEDALFDALARTSNGLAMDKQWISKD